jgi:CRP-like cAMP-binding protein
VYELRPIDFKSEELEKLYKDVFGPEHFGLSRADFLRLSNAGYLRTLEAGNHYAEEGSHANSLSILISGSLHVIKSRGAGKKPVFFNSIVPNEFIDSPQWVSRKRVREGERFAVSIVAADTCRYLTWPRENLDALFAISPHLRACLDTLAGYDVALKLYRVDDSLVRANDEEDLLYPANRAHDLSSSRRSPTGGLGGSAAARPFQLESNVLSNC